MEKRINTFTSIFTKFIWKCLNDIGVNKKSGIVHFINVDKSDIFMTTNSKIKFFRNIDNKFLPKKSY